MLSIAEIGINHNGNFRWMEEMIRQVAYAGADIAKLQLYDSMKLFGDDSRKKYELSFEQVREVYEMCSAYKIEFMASVFDSERLAWCEELGVKRYKLASRTVARDPELCRMVIELGKEVFASLGMWTSENTPFAEDNVRLLRCISEYPTRMKSLVRPTFDSRVVGVSDHSYGIGYVLYCISHGATVFEKHFTLSKSLDGNDHIGSMTLDDLKSVLEYGRQLESIHEAVG